MTVTNNNTPQVFTKTQAPSESRGEMKNVGVQRATFRQVLDDSVPAQGIRLLGNIGAKLSGAASTVMSAIGMQAGAQAMGQLGGMSAQMAQTGGSATPAVFTTEIHTLAGGQVGAPGPQTPTSGMAQGSIPGATPFGAGAARMTSNQGTVFGAGAAALPEVGVSVTGGNGGIGMNGSVGAGGANFGGATNPIGAAAGGNSQDQLLNATKQMQETQMSFNLQYLQLQSQMQHENRSYTAISNIMKTKHDTVKNSISNVR